SLISKHLRPEQLQADMDEVAKRSFESLMFEAIDGLLQARLKDSQGRNWKNGYKALAIVDFCIRAGSELCISSCFDTLSTIFALTRFSVAGVVGIPQRTEGLMRKRASSVYSLLVDIPMLRW